MKKICVVIADLGSGGSQKIATGLMKHWANSGHDVTCITLDNGENDFFELPSGVKRIMLDSAQPSANKLTGILANFKRIKKLKNALRDAEPETIVSFIAPTNVLTVLAAKVLKSKVIISERNDPARQSFGFAWDLLRKAFYKEADIVTANSEQAIETLQAYVPENKLVFIPNQLESIEEKYRVPVDKKEKTILSVGRLHPQKDFKTLLHAFGLMNEQHSDWTLEIVGHGPLEQELKNQAKSLGIEEKLTFAGKVSNPYEYYARASLFVLPSLHEGTPNALLEAMGCGVPSIVSNSAEGALPFIKNEEQIFEVGQAEDLAEKMSALIANENGLKRAQDEAQKAVQILDADTIFKQWDELL